jgi:acetate---CoA ligase (ADP-forming)
MNGQDKPVRTAGAETTRLAMEPRRTGPSAWRRYAADEVLRDGGSIHIRAIRSDDKKLLLDHFRGMSPNSVYHRFFGLRRTLAGDDLARFTELDFMTHVGLAATLSEAGRERIIGVGRYVRLDDPAIAEVAFAVVDAYQGRGIGTLLLEHLSRIARESGIKEFRAEVLGDNNRMLEVFAKSGFIVRRSFEAGAVHVSFPTAETDQFLAASLNREQTAAAQSVAHVLEPRSVAVIGASRDPRKIGGAILANLKAAGFTGPIYPISVGADEVQGLKAFRAVSGIDAPVDLAIIAVPTLAVEGAVADCARAGVTALVVITSGFAEISQAGREAQNRLVDFVRGAGMRLVGPNCLGVLNTDPEVRLNATFSPVPPTPGNIGMFSQSGALGIAILDYARVRQIGISSFVSIGNRADVSSNDLLAYWAADPRTKVIALYLESFGNPRRFARCAPEVARLKPIVAVKAGRTAAGTRAASSHSAALANLDIAVEALFEQAGVIRTNTLEEMFDVTVLLAKQPLPAGPRIGVVTNAGGPAILLADACEARGLVLPTLAPKTLEILRSFLPERAGFSNPIDMTASAVAADFERAIAAVGNDPGVDALVAIYIPPMVTIAADAAAGIARGAGAVPSEKPVLAVFLSSDPPPAALSSGPRGSLPCYTFPENAAIALSAAHRYARWRSRERGTAHTLSRFAVSAIRAVIDRVLETADGPRWLSPADVGIVLRAAGIEVASAVQTSLADAPATAEKMGYPLVAKVIAPGLIHKSDVGGVTMGLRSVQDVASAVDRMAARMRELGIKLDGILLQREISEGIEAMVGVTSDPTFGPLIVAGLGGVLVELIKDVSVRLHPVTDADAAEMLAALRSSPLLDGYRGAPPADRAALIGVIMRISALVEAVPELTDLDLNPIKVQAPGKGAIAVDARMRVARAP